MRKLKLYLRLAWRNLFKNGMFYLPYLLAGALCAAMFYIIRYLCWSGMSDNMMQSVYVQMMLTMGTFVLALTVGGILLYANGFIMKRRTRELGLYAILGMQKRQVGHVLTLESMIMGLASLVSGLAAGILFSKLALMALAKLLAFEIPLGFSVSVPAILETAATLGAIYVLLLLRNLYKMQRMSLSEQLRADKAGEKEPKTRLIGTILGVLTLGGGYGLAVFCDSPINAFMWFIPAVILVIIGTYLLFSSVSIAILKALKKNRSFYYKPRHFTAVSGMLHRMHENSRGLANICILGTMMLVAVSTTVCMYAGTEGSVVALCPNDMTLAVFATDNGFIPDEQTALFEQTAQDVVAQSPLPDASVAAYQDLSFSGAWLDNSYSLKPNDGMSAASMLSFFTLADYNRMTGRAVTLASDELLVCDGGQRKAGETVTFGDDLTYTVKESLTDFPVKLSQYAYVSTRGARFYFVVADMDEMAKLNDRQLAAYGSNASRAEWRVDINADGSDADVTTLYNSLRSAFRGMELPNGITSSDLIGNREDYYASNGSFLFLGLFLGFMFLLATVLIIYYKQLSEGWDDRDRFIILEKVGMSTEEVRATIRSQVLMIFFLPLLVAGLHVGMAFPMISLLLRLFNLTDTLLFLRCTGITFGIFALGYIGVYALTAKKYYQIVHA